MTQISQARNNVVTSEMEAAAIDERLPSEFVRRKVAEGRAVIPANKAHKSLKPIVIGRDFRTKVNANIGRSHVSGCLSGELVKLEAALKLGADTVMDLSTGEKLRDIRISIIEASHAPIGTVPVYEIVDRAGSPDAFDHDLLLEIIKEQAEQGVDYMTIHAGLLQSHVPMAKQRVLGIVSRGGAIIAKWMDVHHRENPFYERFDDILRICATHDVTLSLGDGLRPGCLADASDAAQFAELDVLGALVRRCRDAGVQAMVEGPGHVPLHQIEMNMRREEEVCDGAPFYVLGPVVADCAPGYDHITSAIGGTLAAFHGAAMLCYVTPMEHLGLPTADDVRTGVVAHKLAAHAADVALGRPGARERDDAVSKARANMDWEGQFVNALDPDHARAMRAKALADHTPQSGVATDEYCTMCGPNFCSVRNFKSLKK